MIGRILRSVARVAWLLLRIVAAMTLAAFAAAATVIKRDHRRRHPRRRMPRSVGSLERRVARGPQPRRSPRRTSR